MNIRDYNYIQYLSIITVILIVTNWLFFSYMYQVTLNIIVYIGFLLILNFGFWIAFYCYFKKSMLILENKAEIMNYTKQNLEVKNEKDLDNDTTP